MTQDALARQAGMDRTHVSEIENGKVNITLETAQNLAAAVGWGALDLFLAPAEFQAELVKRQVEAMVEKFGVSEQTARRHVSRGTEPK